MELDKFGVGSIVEVNGNLYKKRVYDWVVLEETLPAFMGGVVEYKVIASVEKGPLDDFVVGDVISFEYSVGERVAVKIREDRWQLVGAVSEFTSEEILYLADVDSVRKIGSLNG